MRRTLAIAICAAALALGACGKDQKPSGDPAEAGKPSVDQNPGNTAGTAGDKTGSKAGVAAGKSKSDPVTGDPPAMLEAKRIFKTRCVQCHGPDGRGDGPASAALNPKPRNYTDKRWQVSVEDQEIRDIIVKGGMEMKLSPLMPAQPDLADKPELLDALVKLIRSFAES